MTKRHASRRPGSHQNQLNNLRLILPPPGGGLGWAKLIAGRAPPRATAPETAAAPLSNPRRVTRWDDTLAMHVSFLAHLSRSVDQTSQCSKDCQHFVALNRNLQAHMLSVTLELSTLPEHLPAAAPAPAPTSDGIEVARSATLADSIPAQLREAILRGHFPAGEPAPEAQHPGPPRVSRGPLPTARRQLLR